MDSLITKKQFLLAAFHGSLNTVIGYLAANNSAEDVNTCVKFNPNFGISTGNRYSLSGLKGFFYKQFYYDDFNYIHDQHSLVRNNLTYHYVKILSNVYSFLRSYRHSMTALSLAAEMGHTDIVKALLAAPNIDVNTCDSNDCTPLMLAAMYGHTDVVRELLAVPNVNLNKRSLRNGYRLSAAEWAEYYGHHEIAVLIKDKIKAREQHFICPAHKDSAFQARLDALSLRIIAPENLTCPLMQDGRLMADPITVSSGITYDRESLQAYFKHLGDPELIKCPLTNLDIRRSELSLHTNVLVVNLIEDYVTRQEMATEHKKHHHHHKHARNRHGFHHVNDAMLEEATELMQASAAP